MGFSLGRALAGAIAGGAGAAADLADKQIAEATRQREADAQLERQRQLMREQDELIGNRAQRVADIKEAKDNAKLQAVSTFMKNELGSMRKEGLDPGTVAGQRRLATAAAEAGHQDYADKFFDNAIKLDQIKGNEELRKEQMALRLQTAQLARQDRADRRADIDSQKEEFKRQQQINAMSKFQIKDAEGNYKTVSADRHLTGIYNTALNNGLSPREAMNLTTDAGLNMQRLLAKQTGVDPTSVFDDVYATALSPWNKPAASKDAPLPGVGTTKQTPPPAQAKPYGSDKGFFSPRTPVANPQDFDYSTNASGMMLLPEDAQ